MCYIITSYRGSNPSRIGEYRILSNDITAFNTLTFEQAAKLLGQDTGPSGGSSLSVLKINVDLEDADKNDLMQFHGYFKYFVNDKGYVYGKTVRFRPFLNCFQYMHYDDKEKKVVNKSIYIPDFKGTEALDEKGGLRCGKKSKKQIEAGISAEAKEHSDKVSCYRHVWGTVSYTGKTVKGEEVTIENAPCVLKLRGNNFMPPGDAFKALSKSNKLLVNHEFELTTERQRTGSTTWYLIHWAADMTKHLDFTGADYDLFTNFSEIVKVENAAVMAKHNKALKAFNRPSDVADAVIIEGVATTLADDFIDDDIPDLAA